MFPFLLFNQPKPQPNSAVSLGPPLQVARASKTGSGRKRKLPFEGDLYDRISVTNFIDMDKYKLTASLTKSFPINVLSTVLDADLPAKVSLTGKVGTLGVDGLDLTPIGRVGFNVRLLDLGASDSRQKGFLRYRAAARTDGRRDYGFEIDRKIELFSLPNTTLYGNVIYKTSNKTNGDWKTISSFGLNHDFRISGYRITARVGLTPEGDFVYDLRL